MENKIRVGFYLWLSLFFKITGIKLFRKIRINILDLEYEIEIGKGELDIIYHTNILRDYMQLEDFIPSPNAVCLDVGANIGSTSMAWSRTLTRGRIYAIEPHPETYLSLLKNVKINRLEKTILPRKMAIGAMDGEMALFVPDEGTMAMEPRNVRWLGKEIRTPSMTLDSFLEKERIERIDILKIDIEGFEVQALQGAEDTLSKTQRVVLEYHSSELRRKCLNILTLNGFSTFENGSLIFSWKN